MAKIITKNSSTASAVPTTSDLVQGELAVNVTDKRLFTENASTEIVELGTNPSTVTTATATVTGTLTANGTFASSNAVITGGSVNSTPIGATTASTGNFSILSLSGTAVTSTATELNLLDGATVTTDEINYLDGVTSNIQTQLDALQDLDADLTAIAALTPSDGNFIVGNGTTWVAESGDTVLASVGVTATAAELNYTDGVTSNIQTQLDTKSPLASPTFTGTVTIPAATVTGDVSFGDNDKAVFGAGNDLEIYHDGSNSYISDVGAGSLRILAQDFRVRTADNTGQIITGFDGGQVNLYHNGDLKFQTTSTGIDVTGTATMDGLTVDGDGAVNGSFTISGTAEGLRFTETDTTDLNTYITNSGGDLLVRTANDAYSSFTSRIRLDHATGDISFYEDTGTTAKFFWDASTERLGIGNSSPTTSLDITGTVTSDGLTVDDVISIDTSTGSAFSSTGNLKIDIDSDNNTTDRVFQITSDSEDKVLLQVEEGGDISFYEDTGTTPKFFWDASAESLGIGTASPAAMLHIASTGASNIKLEDTDNGYDATQLNIQNGGRDFQITTPQDTIFVQGSTEAMRIDKDGLVGIGTDDPSGDLHVNDDGGTATIVLTGDSVSQLSFGDSADIDVGFIRYTHSGDYMTFRTGGSGEDMRIDSSGNVGIGTNSPSQKLSVNSGGIQIAAVFESTSTNTSRISLVDANTSGTNYVSVASSGNDLALYAGGAERMRIDSSGNLLVGTTASVTGSANGCEVRSVGEVRISRATVATIPHIVFYNPNGQVGSITTTVSTTTYNTSSDQRLKENIADADDAGSKVDAIQVRQFDWKADGSHQDYGMVAQELMTVAPEAVSVPENPEDMMGVDYSKLVPMLIKEIQSLRNRVATLEGN
jgi:hypothetical protein